MTTREYIKNEIDVLPVSTLDTVQEFITYLLYRYSTELNNPIVTDNPQATAFKKQMKGCQRLASAAGLNRSEVKNSILTVRQKSRK